MEQARSITFTIPGTAGAPGVEVKAVEAAGGKIDFTVTVLQTASLTADLRGLFFNVADDAKLAGMSFSQSGGKITDFDTVDCIQLKNGANMQGAASPFDVGLEFGTPGMAKDDIKTASFTLYNAAGDLTLDDIAHTLFGARLTSVGAPTDNKRGEKDGAKLVVTSPAAPHAIDDTEQIFEDGATGLADPRAVAQGVTLYVLANDTDADAGDMLTIVEVEEGLHGTAKIVDGPDADLLPGDAIEYTPATDYAGPDGFDYRISDGHGGYDTAHVAVDVIAVADRASVSVQVVDAADAVDQVRLQVTATQADDDGSEALTALTAGSVPAGVTITPAAAPVVGQPGTLTQEFIVTLPAGVNVDYTQWFSADSIEQSNGDTETGTGSIQIEQTFMHHALDVALSADNASLWANGSDPAADIVGPILGIEAGPDVDLYPYPIHYQVTATIETGLQPYITLEGGTIDAQLDYDVVVDTTYNRTTDTLLLSPTAELVGGSFQSQGAGGAVGLDWVFAYDIGVKLGLDFDGEDFSTLEVWFLDEHYGQTYTLANLFELSSDEHKTISLDLLNGTSGYLSWADVDITGTYDAVTHKVSGSGAANFAGFDSDLDSLLTGYFLGGVSPFDIPLAIDGIDIDAEANLDIAGMLSLLDLDVGADLGLAQKLEMSAKQMSGKVVFENGAELPVVFGQDLQIQNAAATYDALGAGGNGNGVVEFKLVFDGVAQLHNDTDLTSHRTVDYQLIELDFDYDIDWGVEFNGSVHTALVDEHGEVTTPTGIADQTFDVALVGTTTWLVTDVVPGP